MLQNLGEGKNRRDAYRSGQERIPVRVMDNQAEIIQGVDFDVMTTSGEGHSPEQIAEMALAKIIYVAKDANPLIREQAEAYKNNIRHVLVQLYEKGYQV